MNSWTKKEKQRRIKFYINWLMDILLDIEYWARKKDKEIEKYTTFLEGTEEGYNILEAENFYKAIKEMKETL